MLRGVPSEDIIDFLEKQVFLRVSEQAKPQLTGHWRGTALVSEFSGNLGVHKLVEATHDGYYQIFFLLNPWPLRWRSEGGVEVESII